MKKLITILLIMAIGHFCNAGTTYYVSASGNDATGTGAIGSPWKTLFKATSVVRTPGDIIFVVALIN